METKKEEVIIRRAALKDVAAIYSLGKKTEELNFSPNMIFHDRVELNEFIKKPNTNLLLIAEINSRIAGFLYAKIVSKTWCILDNLAVEPKHRGKGLGQMMLNHLYSLLKKKKISYVQVLEEIHHKKTREFWKKQGFREEKIFVWADKTLK